MEQNKELSKILLEGEVSEQKPSPQAKKRNMPVGKNRRFVPKDGYAWNPIFQHMERNEPCLCGSVHKWKKCCMTKQPRVVSQNVADHMYVKIEQMKAKIESEMWDEASATDWVVDNVEDPT